MPPGVQISDIPQILALYSFGTARAVERLGGMSNTSYKITTDCITIALRLYTPGHNPASHIALELEVLQHLARKRFPAPHPLAGIDGALLQHWQGYAVMACEFIEGVTADSVPLSASVCSGAGGLLARFQAAMR